MPRLFEALHDVAELALGCSCCRLLARAGAAQLEATRMGALAHVRGRVTAFHVGVMAARRDCLFLARRLLGKAPGAMLSDLVVRGAMCELASLLAGGVRRRLSAYDTVSVGQAWFVEGAIHPRRGWLVETSDVELDGVAVGLVCLSRRELTASNRVYL